MKTEFTVKVVSDITQGKQRKYFTAEVEVPLEESGTLDVKVICYDLTLHPQMQPGTYMVGDIIPSKFANKDGSPGTPILSRLPDNPEVKQKTEAKKFPDAPMSKDDWAEKDRIEREGKEFNTSNMQVGAHYGSTLPEEDELAQLWRKINLAILKRKAKELGIIK